MISSLPRNEHGTLLQQPADRPDIVARVFKLKLDALLEDLFEHKMFGEVAGYAWTIEYQVQECLEKELLATILATSHSESLFAIPLTPSPRHFPLTNAFFCLEAGAAACAYPPDPETHHRQTEDRRERG